MVIVSLVFLNVESWADTVRLKNGGKIEGVIEKEDPRTIEVDIGFGVVTLSKDQIDNIYHSPPEEVRALRQQWEEERIELKKQEGEFDKERERRFKEAYEDRLRESREKRLKESHGLKEIQAMRDMTTKGIVVNALLNGKVNAVLILDTGASLVVLSKKMGEKLGIDTSAEKDIIQLKFTGNNRIKARAVILESISIQDVEVKNVLAAILIDDIQDTGFKDGLLGMSFLRQFNLKIDLKTMKITLEKLKN